MNIISRAAAIFLFCLSSLAAQGLPDSLLLKQTAPDSFRVKFETSKGDFTMTVYRDWSPLAADRFYQLVKAGYYDSVVIFRVVANFVVQFGITNKPAVNEAWMSIPVADEPVKGSNAKGTVSFARAGRNSRSTQIFINLNDNEFLNYYASGGATGFPPIGRITEGWDNVLKLYSGYGETVTRRQDEIRKEGMTFTSREFPLLDYIKKAYLAD